MTPATDAIWQKPVERGPERGGRERSRVVLRDGDRHPGQAGPSDPPMGNVSGLPVNDESLTGL